jgi:hypothetical protein
MRYLLVTYSRQPGGQIDEQVGFSVGVRSRDLQMCNIILDFKTEKVLKCVVEGEIVPTSYEKLVEYYKSAYPNVIEQLELANDNRFEKKGILK